MADAARAGVQHHADLPQEQPQDLRGLLVPDLVDDLHLEKVVPAAEAAELRRAAFAGPLRDVRRRRAGEPAAVLAGLRVLLEAVAAFQRVADALDQHPVDLAAAE